MYKTFVNGGIIYLSTGLAGFFPSTVSVYPFGDGRSPSPRCMFDMASDGTEHDRTSHVLFLFFWKMCLGVVFHSPRVIDHKEHHPPKKKVRILDQYIGNVTLIL